jgi:hypothetical protein
MEIRELEDKKNGLRGPVDAVTHQQGTGTIDATKNILRRIKSRKEETACSK